MNESNDKMTEIEKLKIRIKKWEKEFVAKNGRKANKNDIDLGNDRLKEDYKRYWKLLEKINLNHIWDKKFNKNNYQSINNRFNHKNNSSFKCFSQKMFDKYLKDNNFSNNETKTSFSFKKKSKPKAMSSLNLDQNSKNENNLNEPKNQLLLNRAQSIDESKLSSFSKNNLSQELNGLSFSPLIQTNSVLNNSNNGIDNSIDFINSDSLVSISKSFNSESNDFNSLSLTTPLTGIKRKSDVFAFDDELSTTHKRRNNIYKDLDCDNNSSDLTKTIDNNNQSINVEKKKKFFSSNRQKVSYSLVIDKPKDDLVTETTVESKKQNKTRANTRKSKPKKIETNFKRLNMKKKVFSSRGYKKFNIRKYKRGKYKQTIKENANNCFKCGQSGHWAQDCNFKDELDNDVLDDELKELGVSKAIEDLQQTIKVKPLLSNESNLDIETLISDALREMGHKSFRPNQELTIRRILSGKSCLLISSTGSGKSLCYQLPAYLYWKYRKAITLVISPLISLMEDQLTTFPKCINAVCIHSGLNPTQRQSAFDRLLTGEAQVLLLSPEAIACGNTCISFNALPPIAFVCIDEAHCLSEWSNNFRPSYLQLYRVLREKMKIETFLALTATATKQTSVTIARTLSLDHQNDIIGTTLVPENLVLTVSKDINKDLALIDLLKSDRFKNLKSIIVYCTRREQTERLASLIRISLQDIRDNDSKSGKSVILWDAKAYHAGMTSDERNRVQKRFIRGDLRVIVATIAFGMGINKADIRGIIHYNLPKSFENYMQEIGRAGRDGHEAHCHLFLDSDGKDLFELQRHIFANSTDRKCLRKLIEKVFKSCKCNKMINIEDHENESNSDIREGNVCPGHEIAFPIESTVLELDLKEETILTLMTYLELDYCKGRVKLLPAINSMCTILCYGEGSQQMKQIAQQCPPIAIALTLHQRNNSTQEIPNKLKFSLVEVCSMLGKQLSQVRNQLRDLEWQLINGRRQRTNVRIMFTDLSFHLKSVGDLTEQQMNDILEFLHQFTQKQEMTEVSKLRNVYLTFKQYSQKQCTNKVNASKSSKLKTELNNYFNNDNNEEKILSDNDLSVGTHVFDLEQARRDIRDLLSIHGDQNLSSARIIARILQGIGSPRFPAEVWGKVRRFWRSNVNVNFNDLMKIANEELVRLKSF
jgi:ATP-dependent DNA helicase Q4